MQSINVETSQKMMEYDLKKSGLSPKDIYAREAQEAELASCRILNGLEGYVIPYFTVDGTPLDFYRLKIFGGDRKYSQIKNTPTHMYFPPNLNNLLNNSKTDFIVLTEGEKKAAACVKQGIPAVAVGGVDAWRNRVLVLPKTAEFAAYKGNDKLMGTRIEKDCPISFIDNLAKGFREFVSLCFERQFTVFMVFDTDLGGIKWQVQLALAELGFELRGQGLRMDQIRQVKLPSNGLKVGVDDYLMDLGVDKFKQLLMTNRTLGGTFPIHPRVVEYINKKLASGKIDRTEMIKISTVILADMDSRGLRMYSKNTGALYYYERSSKKLITVDLDAHNITGHNLFNRLMYTQYNLSLSADSKVFKWLSTQYIGEAPIIEVEPYRVLAKLPDNAIRYQLSDSEYVKITSQEIKIKDNGTDSVLFVAEQVQNSNTDELLDELHKRGKEPLQPWWLSVLSEVRLKEDETMIKLLTLLYYISPWFLRWRGTQLPAELIIGEAGSGKSTLCELRLEIISGVVKLRNIPSDIKDWYASVASTGGLHVTDNVQMSDKALRDKLSNEVCRLITEPNPSIEMRKYYTNAELMNLPVDIVFVFTSINQPFTAIDLLQRSIKIELDKSVMMSEKAQYDSNWKNRQLDRFGGRIAWVSHHIDVLHRLLQLIDKKWDYNYKARNRLINLEQLLILIAELFGMDTDWIAESLVTHVSAAVIEGDWVIEGLLSFSEMIRGAKEKVDAFLGIDATQAKQGIYYVKDLCSWFMQCEDFKDNTILTNSRKLGRYLVTNKTQIQQLTGLHEDTKKNNKLGYKVK